MGCIVYGVVKSWTQLSEFHFSSCLASSVSMRLFISGSWVQAPFWASLVAQIVKNLPEMQATQVWSLQCGRCWFDPRVRKIPWKKKWQSTPVFLPEEFHGQRSLEGYSPWAHKESDRTDWLTLLHMVVLCLVSKEVFLLFSTVAAPIYISIKSIWGFLFLANICYLCPFW